jgi:hypothetical protein
LGGSSIPAVVLPPLHLLGALPRSETDFHAERVEDPIEELALQDVIQSSAAAAFWRVLDVGDQLRRVLLKGDILVEWETKLLPYDLVRVDSCRFFHDRKSDHQDYANVPTALLGHHQAECLKTKNWSIHRSKNFAFCCDPYGRVAGVVEAVRQAGPNVIAISRPRGDFFEEMTTNLLEEIRWMRAKTIHAACWDGLDRRVSAGVFDRALNVAEWVDRTRTQLKVVESVGATIQLDRMRGSVEWWWRLERELQKYSLPTIQNAKQLFNTKHRSWVMVSMAEFRLLAIRSGWSEFDPANPPIRCRPPIPSARRLSRGRNLAKDDLFRCG